MDSRGSELRVSAGDLAKHLACRHLTSLDLKAARGEIQRIYRNDPALKVLEQRGFRHEQAYLAHLAAQGVQVTGGPESSDGKSVARTIAAMKAGSGAIVQAALEHGQWRGRADILLKIDEPSELGNWSYEVVDTKLARDTRGSTILQLCLYSEMVASLQGRMPDRTHVVAPGGDFEPETFRLADYLAYYRYVKARLENAVTANRVAVPYPEPAEQCDVCQWWPHCNDVRRRDDHLSFVAGISKLQIAELRRWDVSTLASLAALPFPIDKRPERGSPEGFARIREQARLQAEYRRTSKPVHELLPLDPGHGLARLPEPSPGDIFLDFEADPFVEGGGLEYLLGYLTFAGNNAWTYSSTWALDRPAERRMFESFIDMVMERRVRFPGLHVYHFSHYEPAALKRLMGRYATREDELDQLLRAGILVDLHGIVKQALRAGVEKYALKDLEIFFGFQRATELRAARKSLQELEWALELGDTEEVPAATLTTIEAYNREDCISARALRDWLEGIRQDLVSQGNDIPRPLPQSEQPSEAVDEKRKRVLALMNRLLTGISDDPAERGPNEQARWLLAHLLEWHRREEKAPWWEFFRLRDLTDEERIEERSAISGLEFVARIGGTAKCPIDRYRFPQQDTQVRKKDKLHVPDGSFGNVEAIDNETRSLDVKKTGAMAEIHPASVFSHNIVGAPQLAESLSRIAAWVADNDSDAPGPYRAARDLLLGKPPRLRNASGSLYRTDVDLVEEARRLAIELDHGILPIQGPPGAGKTYTAARMICSLLKDGKRVGITAVSHKVIRKLLEDTLKAAAEEHMPVTCIEKVGDKSKTPNPAIEETTDNKRVLKALQNGEVMLAAGTAWLWAPPDFAESVDVLFVDEAGQMSLADVLALSQGAHNVILLGDPQQLEQPLQGTHPPGVAVSALQHVLGTAETMPPDRGMFLSETWRLAPAICKFTSELFYENRLRPHPGLELQQLTGATRFTGSGLWFVPVAHEGNQSSSSEEVSAVAQIVDELISSGVSWRNMKGEVAALTPNDILIVSPYNAQVFDLSARLPSLRVGTVDKFQGQEAPVVIYSMATSSPEDAPRGMEFLYSLNRFNVATSRARCACILVGSPRLFEPDCQTPRQMKLANVLCRYAELATQTTLCIP